jgi:hypothetical protein
MTAVGFFPFLFLLQAQPEECVYGSDYRIDPGQESRLLLEIDNLNFFKDNEFSGTYIKGYSLPGFRLQPRAVYHPLRGIRLEAGFHALVYQGAYKYPVAAYKDIARWKGGQYQRGARLLPWFRAQAALSPRFTLVFGNLYGAANHRLTEPLYSPELNLTADPETGFQLLFDSPFLHLDAWLNWQSFIFREDDHQEAFTVGLSSRLQLNRPEAAFHFYIPLQAVVQHRGGEIDTLTACSVQTLMNAAAGAALQWNVEHPVFKGLNIETFFTAYYQQAGNLWPIGKGSGWYTRLSAGIYDFRLKAAYFRNRDFISLYGLPFFGALSHKEENATYDHPVLFTSGLEYSRTFGEKYVLGVDLDIYHTSPATLRHPQTGSRRVSGATSFSAGVYLRINFSLPLSSIIAK